MFSFAMLFQQSIPSVRFKQWLWQDRENWLLIKLSIVVIVAQFVWFKFLYPYPNFMPPDSNSYIEAAFYNYPINIWAIGYSKFLRLVSCFTNSHFVLVWIQYILLEVCLLYFSYSLRYLLAPGKWVFRLLIGCSVLNPLLPHISNFISSDALFTALSLLWFTQLLWIIGRPNRQLLLFHTIILLFVFMVRYNALFYPFVSIAVIAFANLSVRARLLGAGCIVLLLGAFVGRTQYKYYKYMGTAQYSAFGGWQIAANALYGYAYAMPEQPEKVPIRFRELHASVNKHMDSIRHLTVRPDEEVAIYYLWDEKSPLKEYLKNKWSLDSTTEFFKRWATMSPLYASYGRYLIQQHPVCFIRYYLWPNAIKYYAPPTKFMGVYNLGDETVDPIIVTWFGWKNNKVSPRYKNTTIIITEFFTILIAVVNLVFILSFIGFLCLRGFSRCTSYSASILWWMFAVWVGNMIFSVFSAPIELRYQLFPVIITFAFMILLIECIIREMPSTRENVG